MKNDALQDWGLRLVVFAAVVGTWELFLSRSQNFLLPKFTEMVSALFRLWFVDDRFWEALYISNQALLLGYAVSLAVAIPLGLAAGRLRWLDRLLNPYIGVLLAMPVAPLIPIVIIALGLGLSSRVFIVVLFAFIFITVNTRAGVRGVDPSLIEMAKSFGANERQIWRRIVIPGAVARHLRRSKNRAWTGGRRYGDRRVAPCSQRTRASAVGVCRSASSLILYLPQFWWLS